MKPSHARRKHLPVINDDGPVSVSIRALSIDEQHGARWEPRDDVPKTRADCPRDTQFCEHWRCRHNLARVDPSERAGRPGLRHVARDANGHTISQPGKHEDDRRTTIRAWWVDAELPQSLCSLDLAEQGPLDNVEIARALGRHRTLTRRIVESAIKKFRAAGGTLEMLLASMPEPEPRNGNLASAIVEDGINHGLAAKPGPLRGEEPARHPWGVRRRKKAT